MTPAFWDASGLVPLCVQQAQSEAVYRLRADHSAVVWWGTPVEMRSSFERLSRLGQLSLTEHETARRRLEQLRDGWREIQPNDELRAEAERLLGNYPLRAADALQLAAAWVWASGFPQGRTFVSGDSQLLGAARRVGFAVEAV